MTVALVLADRGDAGQVSEVGGQLAALGVRRVDAADRSGQGLLTVASAARSVVEQLLICGGDIPGDDLGRLLAAGGSAVLTVDGFSAVIVDPVHLEVLAGVAEELANGEASADPVGALAAELAKRGVPIRILAEDTGGSSPLADPTAADLARWSAERELTPIALYGISLTLGVLSAVWFSEPVLRATAFAVVALFASFVTGRAGFLVGVLSRAGEADPDPHPVPAAGWFRSATSVMTEFAVYAGMATSATDGSGLSGVFGGLLRPTMVARLGGAGSLGVWRLAVAAMAMLAIRLMTDACRHAGRERPHVVGGWQRVAHLLELPAAVRTVLICAAMIFAGARLTFLLLLAWGALALGYVITERLISGPASQAGAGQITGCRGDGPLALWIGGLVAGRLPPIPPLIVGMMVTCVLAALGLGNLPGVLVLAPAVAMLLAAFGSCSPHDGPNDWVVPPLLQAVEYLYVAALGFTAAVPAPVTFILIAAMALRHLEIAQRARFRLPPAVFRVRGPLAVGFGHPDDAGFGWDGRMLIVGFAAAIGVVPGCYVLLAAYLWILLAADFLTGWLAVPAVRVVARAPGPPDRL